MFHVGGIVDDFHPEAARVLRVLRGIKNPLTGQRVIGALGGERLLARLGQQCQALRLDDVDDFFHF